MDYVMGYVNSIAYCTAPYLSRRHHCRQCFVLRKCQSSNVKSKGQKILKVQKWYSLLKERFKSYCVRLFLA